MPSIYENARAPRLLVGVGALAQLPAELNRCNAGSVLLMCDPGVTWIADKLESMLIGSLPVHRLTTAPGEPVVHGVNMAARTARALPAPVIIGIGGGSALDSAKLVAAMAVAEASVEHYLMCANPYSGKCPSVMIPTTSGTGAEVTRTAICNDVASRKLWAWAEELLPELVVLDPSLTVSLPANLTASTGLDAFTHALEAFTSQRRNPFSQAQAMQAMRLIVRYLPIAVNHPDNLKARQAMQEAAALAGIAIDNCGTGVAHTLGHALGTLHPLPHGVAVTLGMCSAMRWNIQGNEALFDEVAALFSTSSVAADVPSCFERLLSDVNFDAVLAPFLNLKIDTEVLLAACLSKENEPMRLNNVRMVDEAAINMLCRQLTTQWASGLHRAYGTHA